MRPGFLTRIARQVISQSVILLYHRVSDTEFDPQLLCVSPKKFAEHMEVLRATYCPMSLNKLAKATSFSEFEPSGVTITFDDGYEDNFSNAKPILIQYEMPATMFISSGFIGNGQLPYWDELAYLLLQTPELPPELTVSIHGFQKKWLFHGVHPVDVRWNVLDKIESARQDAYCFICNSLQSMSHHSREEMMKMIRKWSGMKCNGSSGKMFMSAEQLAKLSNDGLIEVGAHCISHPNLASLSSQNQRREIVEGKRQLEEIVGHTVSSFAYPYGNRGSYTRETINILKEEGFDCACSNFDGSVWFGTNRYELPRVLVRNWDADEFARIISRYL